MPQADEHYWCSPKVEAQACQGACAILTLRSRPSCGVIQRAWRIGWMTSTATSSRQARLRAARRGHIAAMSARSGLRWLELA